MDRSLNIFGTVSAAAGAIHITGDWNACTLVTGMTILRDSRTRNENRKDEIAH